MTNIWIGFEAGFIATVVLSALMLMQQARKLMPLMDMNAMMADMMNSSRAAAWLVHFMVGTLLYGGAFVVLLAMLQTDAYLGTGVVLGAIGWLLAMIAMMPMAGKGFFGMKIGLIAPAMSLMLHMFFGALLGWAYGSLIT
ncbi:MAG: DUF6789 family protein [Woeseia sp.]